MLEVFNNLFMAIAEQMGVDAAEHRHSVNIKERLDFSCALFDRQGNLIANAPHMPVHLGSMGESVRDHRSAQRRRRRMRSRGDVYVLNAPYNGGTHLPDITVVTPVFDEATRRPARCCSMSPRAATMPISAASRRARCRPQPQLEEEGVLIDDFLLVEGGRFREAEMRALLASGRYPARNPDQNIADLKAQVAACARAWRSCTAWCGDFGRDVVEAYMRHVQDNAEEAGAPRPRPAEGRQLRL